MDTLAAYEGSTEAGRMEGEGIYKYEDGTKYKAEHESNFAASPPARRRGGAVL